MSNFTSNTYTLKRKILTFSKKLSKPERKFTADITYGMLASGSCLLSDVCNQLHEPSKKINVVDRLSRHLSGYGAGCCSLKKATFSMDRGYGDNKMFLKLDDLKQDYVICLKSNRKLLYHNKWTTTTELRNRRKGKVKTTVFYKGKDMKLIFHISKYRLLHPERIFIWCLFTALPNTR